MAGAFIWLAYFTRPAKIYDDGTDAKADTSMTIPTLHRLDRPTLDRHVRAGRPFVVPGFARHWPACERWTPEYLAAACGDTPIPVSHYPDGVTLAGKVEMTVRDYLAAISATPESWRHHYMESVELAELSAGAVPRRADPGRPGRPARGLGHRLLRAEHRELLPHPRPRGGGRLPARPGRRSSPCTRPPTCGACTSSRSPRDYRRSRVAFPDVDYRRFPSPAG